MNSNSEKIKQIKNLIDLSKEFISGEGRNKNYVRELEGLFAEALILDEDDRFEDLQYAFAMFGASTPDYDNDMLKKELIKIIPILDSIKNTS